jgi:hypothetical protein
MYMKPLIICAALVLPTIFLGNVQAATLWTMTWGTDSASCGSGGSPCRSISQAIANAQDGDAIHVGPGRYGNVNGDSTFSGPGDERPEANAAKWDGSGCILCINKGVHIYSTAGADLTVIDSGGPQSQYQSTVLILSDGVDFGGDQHGFTITGGNAHGVAIEPNFSAKGVARNISVNGNIDIGDDDGVYLFGDNLDGASYIGCPPLACTFNARVLIGGNRLVNNRNGVNLTTNNWGGPGTIVVRDNQTIHAGTGYSIFPGYAFGGVFVGSSGNVQLINNIAANGNVGFYAVLTGPIEYNTAIDNAQSGFVITASAPFTFNAALGNGGPGVLINLSPDLFDLGNLSSTATFSENTLIGNDRNRPVALFLGMAYFIGNFNPGPSAHCGVLNLGPLGALGGPTQVTPVPATQLQAANNYWGSATGPSKSGSGDAAGGKCDQNSATSVVRPFLSTAPRGTTPLDP